MPEPVFCANEECGARLSDEQAARGQRYCSRQCANANPTKRARMSAWTRARWAEWHAEGHDPTHGGEAAAKRGAAIAESNQAKPRRKRKPYSRFVSKSLRRQVMDRCAYQCSYCRRRGTATHDPDGAAWHIEHVVPVERGGPTHAENLTLACRQCNLSKSTRPAFAFVLTLALL